MDILDAVIQEEELSQSNILKQIDDYSMFCYYIGQELELGTKYSSPLREGDENPSFSLFQSYGERYENKIFFKDQAAIGSGDIFVFVMRLYNLSMYDALKQINSDFGLGLGGELERTNFVPRIVKKVPVVKERKKIGVISRQKQDKEFLDYWKRYDITEKTRELYCCTQPEYITYTGKESYNIFRPKVFTISYRIGEYYKLYMPKEPKADKFRNDYPPEYVEGYLQIDWTRHDFVVLTKATKECMLFREHWNIQAVAGKSESTPIPKFIMDKLIEHFDRVYIWLDPDEAGIKATNNYIKEYPSLIKCVLPDEIAEKDPTDFYEVYRLKQTTKLISKVLINEQISHS